MTAIRPMPQAARTALPGRAAPVSRKAELLAEAARQFCLKPRPGQQDVLEFKEFFYQLIDGCGKEDRRALAAAIATHPYVPRSVVLYLALDEREIAAPVLLFSPVLNEADIVPLAARLSLGHLHVLCRRADLTPAAAEALIAHGGRSAALILSRNVATTGLSEVRAAVAKAESANAASPRPAEPARPRPPDDAPADVRRQLLELAARSGRLGRDAGAARNFSAGRAAPPQQPAPPAGGAPAGGALAGGALERRLVGLARAGETAALGRALAQACRLPAAAIEPLLAKAETVGALLKGIGVSERAAGRLILALCPQIGRDRDALAAAIRSFDRLEPGQCRAFVDSLAGAPPAAATRDDPVPAVAAESVPTNAGVPPPAPPRASDPPVQAVLAVQPAPILPTPVRKATKRPAVEAAPDPAEAGEAFARALAERRREIARPGPATRGGRTPSPSGTRRMFGRIRRAG